MIKKKLFLTSLAMFGCLGSFAQSNEMIIQTKKTGAAIQSTMYGIFFEDINQSVGKIGDHPIGIRVGEREQSADDVVEKTAGVALFQKLYRTFHLTQPVICKRFFTLNGHVADFRMRILRKKPLVADREIEATAELLILMR